MLVNVRVGTDAGCERGYGMGAGRAGRTVTPPAREAVASAQGTVMVVPSPVALMENVPAVLDVYV